MLREADGVRDVTLLATGSEVEIALAAADMLAAQGLRAAVVSMPCWELFEAQPAAYRVEVLGAAPRVAVEAAVAARLGPLDRRARRLHRHERIWRERAGGRPL